MFAKTTIYPQARWGNQEKVGTICLINEPNLGYKFFRK